KGIVRRRKHLLTEG
ncbi:hypothetical protein VCHC50A2_3809B, partial [Vibrio cholerae HC-50A2]